MLQKKIEQAAQPKYSLICSVSWNKFNLINFRFLPYFCLLKMRIGNDFSRTNDDKPRELLAPVTKSKESRPESEQNVESFFLSSDSSGVLPPEKFELSKGYMLVPGDANYNYSSNGLNSRDLLDLCGVPGICRSTAQRHCFNVTLADCPDCSDAASGFFVFLVLCLGLAILFGNLVILAVSTQLYKMRRATNVDWFKASLAVSDLMTGQPVIKLTNGSSAHEGNELCTALYGK